VNMLFPASCTALWLAPATKQGLERRSDDDIKSANVHLKFRHRVKGSELIPY
jgi:hypothetical protein